MNVTEESKVKFLKNEISAFEGRLASVKSELDSLRKQKEKLEAEAEEIRVRSNQEVEKKVLSARQAASVVEADRAKLSADKEEFQKILAAFKQEKTVFEREREASLFMKQDAQGTMDRVGVFIRMVRDGASKL